MTAFPLPLPPVFSLLLSLRTLMTVRYAALTNVQFLMPETTLTALELQGGETWASLRQAAREARLYGPGKANSQLTILTAVKARVAGLEPELVKLLASGSLEERQLLNLALVTRQKQVLLDFLAEVVVPAWQRLHRHVTDADARAFLTHKAEQEADVAAWTPATMQKTRGNLTRFLQDAGVLKEVRKGEYEMVAQYLTPTIKEAVSQVSPRLALLLEQLK